MNNPYTEKIGNETYAHLHHPNCPSPHEVRLIGNKAGALDMIREHLFYKGEPSKDIVGHGQTFEEAAQDAWTKKYGPVD